MINEIIAGIARKIYDEFGNGYEIYGSSDLLQNMKPPSFFIMAVEPRNVAAFNKRSILLSLFDIHYFPKQYTSNCEMYDIAMRLMWCLKHVTLSNKDTLLGRDFKFDIVDGVLHMFVSFSIHLIEVTEPEEKMKELKLAAKVKENELSAKE